jgi:hypothetical protein
VLGLAVRWDARHQGIPVAVKLPPLPAGLTATAIAANGDAVPENGQHAFAIVHSST